MQNFFTSAESKAFIKTAESLGFVHQGSQGPLKGEAYRDNDRISVNDPVLADAIWNAGLNKLFTDIKIRGKVAVGLNPNIRFYRLIEFSTVNSISFYFFLFFLFFLTCIYTSWLAY